MLPLTRCICWVLSQPPPQPRSDDMHNILLYVNASRRRLGRVSFLACVPEDSKCKRNERSATTTTTTTLRFIVANIALSCLRGFLCAWHWPYAVHAVSTETPTNGVGFLHMYILYFQHTIVRIGGSFCSVLAQMLQLTFAVTQHAYINIFNTLSVLTRARLRA